MRIQIRLAKTTKCIMLPMFPFMLPKMTGKIFLTMTYMHLHFQLCLLGSEILSSEFSVPC